jgi:ABC-type transport system involved in cytochrome c biogenesis permease component
MFLSGVIVVFAYTLTQPPDISGKIVQHILIVIHSIGVINHSHYIFEQDYADGYMEVMLSIESSMNVTVSKVISMIFASVLAYSLSLFVVSVIFNYDSTTIAQMLIVGFLLLTYSTFLAVLVSSIQIYFAHSKVLYMIITPFILPALVMAGLYQEYGDRSFLQILLGVNCIIAPIGVFSSAFLIKNVYK